MKKESVKTGTAPQNLPFSQGIKAGDMVFVSGQGPIGPDGKVVPGDIRAQTRLTLENFRKVVSAAGSTMDNVVQTTVYLLDLADFPAMNEVYSSFFPEPRPARATVRADLLFEMKVEVQGIAILPR
jgi:2-iminobutanoate/2-iminopropanoate deaminase